MVGPKLDLMPGERMVLHSHPHWWFFYKQALGGLGVIFLLAFTIWANGTLADVLIWVTIVAFVGWLLATAYQFVQWQTTRFAVTDQRVAYQYGFFKRGGVSIPLNRVNNVNFEQGVLERMLDNGVVLVESAGETGDSVFENIPNPDAVRNAIFQQMNAFEDAGADRDAAAIAEAIRQQGGGLGGSQGGEGSVEERLRKLDLLLAEGVINEEEHARRRQDIIDSI